MKGKGKGKGKEVSKSEHKDNSVIEGLFYSVKLCSLASPPKKKAHNKRRTKPVLLKETVSVTYRFPETRLQTELL